RREVLVVDVRIAGDDLRLERGYAPREGATDVAEADDADGFAVDRAGVAAGHLPAPQTAVHLPVRDDDPAVPGQEQRERVIRDLADPEIGDVDDDHAQLGRGWDVDDVVPDAGAHDDLEAFERAYHCARDARGRDDERVGVACTP